MKREPKKSEGEKSSSLFKRRTMKFYYVIDTYIQYLRDYDTKVAENKKESRPYVGVVVEIEDIKYYAPFTSPKRKHLNMKNSKDFRKIKNGIYGAINFNNMIPVPDNALVLIDIDNEPNEKYRRLLQNQYKAILSDSEIIIKTAEKLRKLILQEEETLSEYDRKIKARCCDLRTLEKIYKMYDQKK